MPFPTFGATAVGQLVLWNPDQLTANAFAQMETYLSNLSPNWFMNIIGIQRGHNTFFTTSPTAQAWLTERFGVPFTKGRAETDRLWLRKVLMAHDMAAQHRQASEIT
ncbi:MAG TPA: hypothetical protein VI322_03500 [Candidatus Saccharimonadia bacterium]